MLATEITERLDAAERTAVYLLLGCGDNFDAVIRMLKSIQQQSISLSVVAERQLSLWLRGYAGSDGETILLKLMARTGFNRPNEPGA